jgi:hypothetical protein
MILSTFLIVFSLLLTIAGLWVFLHYLFVSKLFFSKKEGLSPEKASTFGDFISGLTGPIFTLAGFLIIYATIIDQKDVNQIQNFESVFFKLLEFHRENCRQLVINKTPKNCESRTGYASFVNLHMQYERSFTVFDTSAMTKNYPFEKKLDLSFSLFFLGSSDSVMLCEFFEKNYPRINASKLHQQIMAIEHCPELKSYFDGNKARLNSFFNQFFAAIELIDHSDFLTKDQKDTYIRMITAQNGYYESNIIHYYIHSGISDKVQKKLYRKYNIQQWTNEGLFPYYKKRINQ